MNYWTFKHKPGGGGETEAREYMKRALSLNSAMMQYEYDLQEKKTVSMNWNRVQEVKEGDYIFLRGDSHVYAIGKVIKPRKKPDVILSIKSIIKTCNHGKYISSKSQDCIHFEETNVFYEDLSDGEDNWGQRIDVEKWLYYSSNGIDVKSQSNYPKGEAEFGVIKQLKTEKAIEIMDKLKKEYLGDASSCLELLENNKNLILTGAPGTGKTYLAKVLAKQLIDVHYDEELNSNEQFEFVQFHPSYDYTDFIEGLRPFKQDGADLGFQLKDGVFKSFCKAALNNLLDSSKTAEDLTREVSASKQLVSFLDESINTNRRFKSKQGNSFIILSYVEDDCIKVAIPNNEITSQLQLSWKTLKLLMLGGIKLNKVNDIRDFLGRTYNAQPDSYVFSLYTDDSFPHQIDSISNVDLVKRKNYVIIIDEINRAEMSKVFGELFFSIDPGYRGVAGKVKTQYSNLQLEGDVFADGFYVPDNVYIIGTMNDIDRSVESMDFAMRRRFAWKEITAESRVSMWNGNLDDEMKTEALHRLINVNRAIDAVPSLDSAYHIGPAYFLKLKLYEDHESPFESLWVNHLKGVLFEYLRGLPDAKSYMNALYKAYNNSEDGENDG